MLQVLFKTCNPVYRLKSTDYFICPPVDGVAWKLEPGQVENFIFPWTPLNGNRQQSPDLSIQLSQLHFIALQWFIQFAVNSTPLFLGYFLLASIHSIKTMDSVYSHHSHWAGDGVDRQETWVQIK